MRACRGPRNIYSWLRGASGIRGKTFCCCVTQRRTSLGRCTWRASALHELGSLAQSDLWRWMARAAVFLHPARYEPFGLAPLEAALHGCALVLGKIDSLREIWGDAASYVEPDDCAELILTARRLAENGAERERLAARARDRAAQFSGRAMARAYATVAGKARRAA
jgi:glycosyltransferase involved in cell wall biosynthesis